MAYADWTFYQDTGCTAFLSLAGTAGAPTPPVDNGWLHYTFASTFTGQNGFPGPGLPHGARKGTYRALVHLVASGANNNNVLGIGVMCSQANMRGGQGGHAYGVVLKDANPLTLQLIKCLDGLDGGWEVLAAHLNAGSLGTTYAVEIAWDASPAGRASNLGVMLTVRLGTLVDFSDLAVVPEMDGYLDSSSPLTTTVGESVLGRRAVGFFEGYIDQTTLVIAEV